MLDIHTSCASLSAAADFINSVAAVGEGLVASGSDDGDVRIWNVVTGKCVKILKGHDGAFLLLCLLPASAVYITRALRRLASSIAPLPALMCRCFLICRQILF